MRRILNLNDYLSFNQQQEIVARIKKGCIKYQNYLKSDLYEPYTEMRQKHQLTSYVLSQFSPDKCSINGLLLRDKKYGLNNKMVQPELYSDNVILHLYSNGTSLKSKIVKKYCKLYNHNLDSKPIFLIVIFNANKDGDLKSVCVKLTNSDSSTKEKFILFTKHNLKLMVS